MAGPGRGGKKTLYELLVEANRRSGYGSGDKTLIGLLRNPQARSAEVEKALVNAAIEWLTEVWGAQRPCPYCGHTDWSVGTPYEIQLASGQTLAPHFTVMCETCGNTVFINAILAGIVPEPGSG